MAEPQAPIPLLRAGHPRRQAIWAGVRLEIVTVAWMSVEAVVAIGAGLLAHSVLLTAFGLDSVIALVCGGLPRRRTVAPRTESSRATSVAPAMRSTS